MKTLLLTALTLLVLTTSTRATTEAIKEGECWSYATRPGEEDSYVVIRKIMKFPKEVTVVGISIIGLKLKLAGIQTGIVEQLPYVAVHSDNLRASLRARIDRTPPESAWEMGHQAWWTRYGSKGRTAASRDPLGVMLEHMEQTAAARAK